jgi:hypothetical protein
MARTRTLAQLRADVCNRADISDGGSDVTKRHPSSEITRYINQAIQSYMQLVTDAGCQLYIKQAVVSTSTSSTVDTANWAPRDYLAMPTDLYHLKGIDITSGGATVAMQPFELADRNDFRAQFIFANGGIGMPILYQLGGVNQAGLRVAKVIPSSDAVYSCVVWYLPVAADLVADGDTFDGIAGYEEWVVNRAALDCLMRDASLPIYGVISRENAALEARMRFDMARAGGPQHRSDTRGQRRLLSRYPRGFWRGP